MEDSKGLKVPIRDKVLLHLREYRFFKEDMEVPFGMSQAGIAKSLNVNRSQVTKVLKELRQNDMVEERVTYVQDVVRRCKVYSLTMPGEIYADKLRTLLLATKVDLRDAVAGRRAMSLSSVYDKLEGDIWFSQFIFAVLDDRVVLRPGPDGKGFIPDMILERDSWMVKTKPLSVEKGPAPPPVEEGAEVGKEVEVKEEKAPPVEATFKEVTGSSVYDLEPPPPPPMTGPYHYPQYPYPYQYGYQPTQTVGWSEQLPWAGHRAQTPTQVKAQAKTGSWMFFVGIFTIFMGMVSFSSAFTMSYSYAPFCCLTSLVLWVVGPILILTWWTKRTASGLMRLGTFERCAGILSLVIGLAIVVGLIGSLMDSLSDQDIFIMMAIGLPLYVMVGMPSGIPAYIRAEIGLAAGAFLALVCVVTIIEPSLIVVSWGLVAVLLIEGIGLMLMGQEIGSLWGLSGLRAAVPGLGAGIVTLTAVALYNSWPLDLLSTATLVAWMVLSIYMLALPFLKDDVIKKTYKVLGRIALICFGVALLFLGISLVLKGYFVGAIEIILSAPVLFYGWRRFRSEEDGMRASVLTLTLFLVVEVISMIRLLWLF